MTFFSRSSGRSKTARHFSIMLAVALALITLGELTGWPFLRSPLEQQLSKLTHASVALDGKFRAQLLFHPGVAVEHVTVGSASDVEVPHLLQANGFVVRWRWSDLWRARQGAPLRLTRLEADHIDAHLVRRTDGHASWAPARAKDTAQSDSDDMPEIDALVLRAGTITYRDAPLNVDLVAHITQNADTSDPMPWRATAKGRYRGTALDLKVQAAADLPIWIRADGSNALTPLKLSGRFGGTQLEFDGAAGALWAGENLTGKIDVRGASLRTSGDPLGLTLPATPPYRLRGRIAREGAVWSLTTQDTTVGSSALTADMHYDTATTPPTLAGKLGGKRLAFADLAPSVGADQPPREASRVLPDAPFDLPSLARMNADVQVDLAQLDFGTPSIAPMTDLKVHVTLDNSRLALSDLNAHAAGGVLTGSTSLQANQHPPRWDAALQLADVDLKQWIRSLKKGDASARKEDAPAYLSGKLNAKVSLVGQGNSVADILGSGNGQLNLALEDAEMSQLITEAIGLDVAQSLGMLIRGDVPLRLNCARAEAAIQDGVVKTRYAVLDNKDSTLHIQGGLSLKNEALQLRLVAEPKDFSPLSLRSPLNITGNFKNPKVTVETRNLLARAAGALALAALAPPAALLAFIDTGSQSDTEPCAIAKPSTTKKP